MFKKIKAAFGYTATNKLISKEAEYKLYEKVAQDIASEERDEGIWTLAFSKSEGNTQKTEAKYIELMVQRYKDWLEAGVEISEILENSYREFEEKGKEAERKAQKAKAQAKDDQDFDIDIWLAGIGLLFVGIGIVVALNMA